MKSPKLRSYQLFFLFALSPALTCGQIVQVKKLTTDAKQYEKTEWAIQVKSTWKNPYDASDVALNMHLTTPSGESLILPCYFESGKSKEVSDWRARFAARETGTYDYKFEFLKSNEVVDKSAVKQFTVVASDEKGFLNPNNYWTFKYDNGELFRGIGENICWESRDEDDSKFFEALHEDSKYNYDFMLKKLAANGGNFFRTWMIYWNLPVDWKKVKNNRRYQSTSSPYNESGMKRMDWLLELCDSLGIHMMLALESHAGLLGTGWDLSNYNVVNGGYATTPLEFFTLPEARAQYKNKLRLMVARYGYSRSIAAWEFFNEIDNVMYSGKTEDRIPDSVITAWHDEMSDYLKRIDPFGHMITTSVSHRDVAGMNDLKNLDINQKHIYKNTDAIPSTLTSYSVKHKKPYIIGEFGYEWDWSKNFDDFAADMDNDFRKGLWLGLFSPTPVMPMSWWWEFFENRGMMEYFKNVRTFSDFILKSGNGKFESIEVSGIKNLQAFGLKTGDYDFVYVYNTSVDLSDIEFKLQKLPANTQIRFYDCETGNFGQATTSVNSGTLSVNNVGLNSKSGMILFWEL